MENPRTFIVPITPDRRAVITIQVEEDAALPTPLEKADWQPTPASRFEIRAALINLASAPDLTHLESI